MEQEHVARILRLICHVALCLLSFGSFAQVPDAQSEQRLGVAAYENAAYKEAVEHLERAVSLDPTSTKAHLYLADAYNERHSETCEFDSGQASDINVHWRVLAIAEYKKVLELDGSNTQALNSLGHRYYWNADLDEAERYYRKAIDVDPSNSEALYTLAVIDWQRSYRLRMQKRIKLKLCQNQPLIALSACAEIRAENLARIDEGIVLLTRTLQVLDAGEAMAYMAILYRERADIQCDDDSAYTDDLRAAARWHERACETWHNPDRAKVPWRWPASPPPPPSKNDASCPF
jgi:tetratricopeptide (TPR) repeat protein